MSTYGPPARIDGPPPSPPRYGLIQATEAPNSGVRLLPDADTDGVERWIAGGEVFPYPSASAGGVHDACAGGPKDPDWNDDIENPVFLSITVWLPVKCKAYRVWNHDEFKARAVTAFEAVEGSLVAAEFMRGTVFASQPYLADGEGDFPLADVSTSPKNGLAELEEAIAATGRRGIVHMSPAVALMLGGVGHAVQADDGYLASSIGTTIIPDAGYVGGSQPPTHAAGEWIYATGPIDIRRTGTFVIPDRPSETVNRSNNEVIYTVERSYLVVWDAVLHAAVLVDRCQDEC